MKIFYISIFTLIFKAISIAQSPTDAEFMPKGDICAALMYGKQTWKSYWESSLLRENENIGILTKTSLMPFIGYGLNEDIILALSVPYISSKTSHGTIAGTQGLQDLSISLKARLWKHSINSLQFSPIVVVGASSPISNYNEDYGPASIGLGASEIFGRGMIDLTHTSSGIYLRPQISYHMRGLATIERNFYYDSEGHYSDKIDVPNMVASSVSLGARLFSNSIRVEATYSTMRTIGGSEIRRQEMPLANANMDADMAGFFLQYYPSFFKKVGIIIIGNKVLSGQNVGKANFINFGLTYQFGLTKKSTEHNG